jgi:hypothetical protein
MEKSGFFEKDFGEVVYRNFDLKESESSNLVNVLEFMIYFVGFLGTIFAIVQAYGVWAFGSSVVSLASWVALAAFTPFWIFYGILNGKFTLAMTYIIWLIANVIVIVGIYVG